MSDSQVFIQMYPGAFRSHHEYSLFAELQFAGGISMRRGSINDRQMSVLELLLEGYTIGRVAERIGQPERTVYADKDRLAALGYIQEIPGCKSPRLYGQGPKFNIAYELLRSSGIQSKLSGGAVVRKSSPGVRVTQAHTQDPVVYQVAHQGDMHYYKGAEEHGLPKAVKLFGTKPYQNRGGYEAYKCAFSWKESRVTLEYRDSLSRYEGSKDEGKEGTLFVYPPRLELTASDIEEQPASYFFKGYTEGITNHLSKYAHWSFYEPTHSDKRIEYAFLDEDLTKNLPKYKELHPDPRVWVDCSTGVKELETGSQELAIKILRLPVRDWSWTEIAKSIEIAHVEHREGARHETL